MWKILGMLVVVLLATMMSGCLESDGAKFRIDGEDDYMTGIFAKFMIVDQTEGSGNVAYKICWDDGTCCCVKPMPVNVTLPLKHAWFISGNYTVTATATYDDGSTFTVTKMMTIRDQVIITIFSSASFANAITTNSHPGNQLFMHPLILKISYTKNCATMGTFLSL